MNIVLLVACIFLLIRYKNKNVGEILSFLSQADVSSFLKDLNGLGLNINLPDYLNEDNVKIILNFINGQSDLKDLLPMLIKILASTKKTIVNNDFAQKKSPLDKFADEDIKTAFYSYLHK